MNKAKPIPISTEPPMLNLEFPKDTKVEGLGDVVLNQEITVIVKGTVKSVGENQWDQGKHLRVLIQSTDIHGTAKKTTLSDAVNKAGRRV